MMKKWISLFLAICFVLSLSVSAFAEEETAYNWQDVEGTVNELFGEEKTVWQIEEVDASLLLPNMFLPTDLTEEDRAEGCIRFFMTEDGSSFVSLYYTDSEGLSLDTYYTYFSQNGVSAEKILVNGVPAVLQIDEENDSILLMFQTRDNKLFQTILYPYSWGSVMGIIVSTIRPNTQEEAVEPIVPVHPVSTLISK